MDIEHSAHRNGRSGDSEPARERWPRLSRLVAVTGAILLLGVTAAACSGASSPGVASVGATATTGGSNDQSSGDSGANDSTSNGKTNGLALAGGSAAQGLALAQCMRAHGVADFPDPNAQGQTLISGGPNSDLNPNNPTFEKAMKAC